MKEEQSEEKTQKKEYVYRGKPLEHLQTLDVRESAKYMKSRSRRAVLRNFDKIEKFIQRCEKRIAKKKKIKTHLRDLVIVPKLVGMQVGIHDGHTFKEVLITVEMIGHRLGEFAPTRVKPVHTTMGIGATKSSRSQKK